jgi:hypothetical protein
MVTQAEVDALADRVEKLEQDATAHDTESLAGRFSILRAIVASCEDPELRRGGLVILAELERKVRPLGIALERAGRIAQSRQQLLDAITPTAP